MSWSLLILMKRFFCWCTTLIPSSIFRLGWRWIVWLSSPPLGNNCSSKWWTSSPSLALTTCMVILPLLCKTCQTLTQYSSKSADNSNTSWLKERCPTHPLHVSLTQRPNLMKWLTYVSRCFDTEDGTSMVVGDLQTPQCDSHKSKTPTGKVKDAKDPLWLPDARETWCANGEF